MDRVDEESVIVVVLRFYRSRSRLLSVECQVLVRGSGVAYDRRCSSTVTILSEPT